MPPSVSVRAGDWKLIRIFHGGDDGKHRYKLFNLSDDLGEQNDLAAEMPHRVTQLDQLIDTFLTDTGAVVPLPNPDFDATKYQPELEGIAILKGSSKAAKTASRPGKPVAGWQPGGTCTLSLSGDALVVTSDGGDPHLSFALPQAIPAQALTLRFTMIGESDGDGQVFWHEHGVRPAFIAKRSVVFDAHHNGQTHDYEVSFTADQPVLGIRIDPSRGPGKVQLSKMTLTTSDGTTVHKWDF